MFELFFSMGACGDSTWAYGRKNWPDAFGKEKPTVFKPVGKSAKSRALSSISVWTAETGFCGAKPHFPSPGVPYCGKNHRKPWEELRNRGKNPRKP